MKKNVWILSSDFHTTTKHLVDETLLCIYQVHQPGHYSG